MKITVVCKTSEWQVEKLKEEAALASVSLEVIDIVDAEMLPNDVGDVVLWRSSSLGSGSERKKALTQIHDRSFLINRCLALIPQATEKAFQQEYLQRKTTRIHGIPTFQFADREAINTALEDGTLKFPFIQKPNKGSKGQGVELISSNEALPHLATDIEKQVYQNFIKNSGDFRVFILGGRMLGAVKRIASEGSHLNNISQGGRVELVSNPEVLTKLRKIGTTAAAVFELTLCGVDVIFDEEAQKYLFLEINTVPQWKGFQNATGINVAREVIQYCLRMHNRKTDPLFKLVNEEYRSQLHLLGPKRFHLLSRLYLWNQDDSLKRDLLDMQAGYIGISAEEHQQKLHQIFSHVPEHGDLMVAKKEREFYFKKYPLLEPALNLLFKNLFAKEIYAISLSPYIRELVSDEKLLDLKKSLEADTEALRILSTHAINYLYMLEAYLQTQESIVPVEKLLATGKSYLPHTHELQIYFFTHCIIGASRFYSREIPTQDLPQYQEMLLETEKIILNNFESISLDNKFEFLACAKMCKYPSLAEDKILEEAARSLASDGNFLIDIYNKKAAPEERNDLVGSEHRNVLYLMSQTPYHPLSQ